MTLKILIYGNSQTEVKHAVRKDFEVVKNTNYLLSEMPSHKSYSKACFAFKVTPTTFWPKCKNLPKCTKFCSTRKLEVAAKNFGLLTKNCLMHWQILGLKGSTSSTFCVVCSNL